MAIRAVAVVLGVVLLAALAIGLAAALRYLVFLAVGLAVGFAFGWILGRTSRSDDGKRRAIGQREPPAVQPPTFDPREAAEAELDALKRELKQ